eukprot:8318365-Ditylum_brightwellii.AAC.1
MGQYRKAIQEWRTVRVHSYKIRQQFLECLADDKIKENNQDKAKIIKRIKDTESKQRMYAILRQYFKPGDPLGLTQVLPHCIRPTQTFNGGSL